METTKQNFDWQKFFAQSDYTEQDIETALSHANLANTGEYSVPREPDGNPTDRELTSLEYYFVTYLQEALEAFRQDKLVRTEWCIRMAREYRKRIVERVELISCSFCNDVPTKSCTMDSTTNNPKARL